MRGVHGLQSVTDGLSRCLLPTSYQVDMYKCCTALAGRGQVSRCGGRYEIAKRVCQQSSAHTRCPMHHRLPVHGCSTEVSSVCSVLPVAYEVLSDPEKKKVYDQVGGA